ncbi:vanadium-dependent haloperoxidase [bacterium]|nr:vanadium-dependent haloperoxidase [bacterium]
MRLFYRGPWVLFMLLLAMAVGSSMAARAEEAAAQSNIIGFENSPQGQMEMDPMRMHYAAATRDGSAIYPDYKDATAAYKWINNLQEVTATDVEKVTKLARPTIIARQMMIVTTAMYEAWAAYDEKAVGTQLGGKLRRPASERTEANKAEAISYAAHHAMLYVFPQPELQELIHAELREMGFDPANESTDTSTPAGVGNVAAEAVVAAYRNDGSNQAGDVQGSNGKPYSDWTGYVCKNTADECKDPNHWMPKWFTLMDGTRIAPGGLTPQWGRVKTVALNGGDQFRPGPPPGLETSQLKAEVDEVIRYTATLTPMQKAIVEFMRDGPRSTGQSGHWLRFAQDLSRRDKYNLDQDVKLFFAVGAVCHDAFVACWDAKYVYDSPRPQALVKYYYKGKMLPDWLGYGKGVGMVPAEEWKNYSPDYFVCPPFPSYPSGHSTVSAGASTILKLFSGSDWFGFCAPRVPGSITHEPMDEAILLELPTFTATAEMAGISRVMGGFHTQSDNIVALDLGRKVASYSWPIFESYFNGTAKVPAN